MTQNPFAYASPDRSERIARLLFLFLDRAGVTFSSDEITELGQLADDICASEPLVVDCVPCEGTGSFDAPTTTGVPAKTYARGTCPECHGLGRVLTERGEEIAEVMRIATLKGTMHGTLHAPCCQTEGDDSQ